MRYFKDPYYLKRIFPIHKSTLWTFSWLLIWKISLFLVLYVINSEKYNPIVSECKNAQVPFLENPHMDSFYSFMIRHRFPEYPVQSDMIFFIAWVTWNLVYSPFNALKTFKPFFNFKNCINIWFTWCRFYIFKGP